MWEYQMEGVNTNSYEIKILIRRNHPKFEGESLASLNLEQKYLEKINWIKKHTSLWIIPWKRKDVAKYSFFIRKDNAV